jgi:hypothetical protein
LERIVKFLSLYLKIISKAFRAVLAMRCLEINILSKPFNIGQLKIIFAIPLLTSTSLWLVSCQTTPMQTIFVATQKDTSTGFKETKIYKLKKKSINSDFNYSKLDDIDGNIKDTINLRNIVPIFEPVSGPYVYYQFISTFKGHSFDELDKDFHDILIIKTDNENKIIDAFQYTLEWAEPPLQFDLYRSNIKNVTLINDLDISSLRLTRKEFWDEKDRIHKESGRLKLEQ